MPLYTAFLLSPGRTSPTVWKQTGKGDCRLAFHNLGSSSSTSGNCMENFLGVCVYLFLRKVLIIFIRLSKRFVIHKMSSTIYLEKKCHQDLIPWASLFLSSEKAGEGWVRLLTDSFLSLSSFASQCPSSRGHLCSQRWHLALHDVSKNRLEPNQLSSKSLTWHSFLSLGHCPFYKMSQGAITTAPIFIWTLVS